MGIILNKMLASPYAFRPGTILQSPDYALRSEIDMAPLDFGAFDPIYFQDLNMKVPRKYKGQLKDVKHAIKDAKSIYKKTASDFKKGNYAGALKDAGKCLKKDYQKDRKDLKKATGHMDLLNDFAV